MVKNRRIEYQDIRTGSISRSKVNEGERRIGSNRGCEGSGAIHGCSECSGSEYM